MVFDNKPLEADVTQLHKSCSLSLIYSSEIWVKYTGLKEDPAWWYICVLK